MVDIQSNIEAIRQRISSAAASVRRDPSEILLLAISKTMPPGRISEAVQAGQVHFGENRIQEARDKIPGLPSGLIWHLVGHLQSNKAKYCPDLFGWIHSIDSVPLAREVAHRYREKEGVCKTLIQVNVSGEAVKFGCDPEHAEAVLEALLEEEGTDPLGLMTIPPWDPDPEASRPWFSALRQLRDELCSKGYPEGSLGELSMGMTGDFDVAIEEGATIVRIGTAIFGARG